MLSTLNITVAEVVDFARIIANSHGEGKWLVPLYGNSVQANNTTEAVLLALDGINAGREVFIVRIPTTGEDVTDIKHISIGAEYKKFKKGAEAQKA